MNVVLIQPPVQDFYFTPIRSFPLGLCYLTSSLKEKGHKVTILDCIQGGRNSHKIEDDVFNYMRPFYPKDHLSPFGLFKKFSHFGLPFNVIEKKIAELDGEVFGISSLFAAYADEALRVARIVKDVHPEARVIMGGSFAHEYGEYILTNYSCVDFVIFGEGEETFCELIDSLDRPQIVSGIAYKKGRDIIKTTKRPLIEKLSSLPWPARDILDLDLFTIGGRRYTQILTSRGCPMDCTFCTIPRFMGRRFRFRDVDDVCDEIIYCYDKLNIRIFDIEDDNFTCDPDHAKELLWELIERLEEKEIEITAMNGLYYEGLDDELINLLFRCGMRRINVSLVSSSGRTKEQVKRNTKLRKFEEVVRNACKLGMHCTMYFIIGLPNEGVEDMIKTLGYVAGLPALIGPSVYYHVPGSQLFSHLEGQARASRDNYRFFRSTAFFYECDMFTRKDLVSLFRLTRIINFIKKLLETEESLGNIDLSVLIEKWTWGLDKKIDFIDKECIRTKAPLSQEEAGVLLLEKFLDEHRIFSLIKQAPSTSSPLGTSLRIKEDGMIKYKFVEEDASPRVIDSFFNYFSKTYVSYGDKSIKI